MKGRLSWAQKITCRHFNWMFQLSLSSWWKLEHSVKMSVSYFPSSSWVTDNLFIIYILPNCLSPLLSPPLFPPSLLSSPVSPLPPSTCSTLRGWCMQVWTSSQRNVLLLQSLLRRMTEWSMLPLHINQKMQQRIARRLPLQHQKQKDTRMQVRV